MKMRPRILLVATVFLAVLILSVKPSWWLVENRRTRDFSLTRQIPAHLFAVLVKRQGKYAVDFYPGLEAGSQLVTSISDGEILSINRDLAASALGQNSGDAYFKILKRSQDSIDVEFEPPAKGDWRRKNSYRLQNGEISPQRIVFINPVFTFLVFLTSVIAAIVAAWFFNRYIAHR